MKRAVSAINEVPEEMKDAVHGIKMGVSSDICDNAKVNLYIICNKVQIIFVVILEIAMK